MTHWTRSPASHKGLRLRYEPAGDGRALRRAAFDRSLPVPHAGDERSPADKGASVAASRDDLRSVCERLGPDGVPFHETVYGVPTDGPVEVPPGAEDVAGEEFRRAWDTARRDRRSTRHRTGPLPEGSLVTGTVTALPWGPGITGLVVDIGGPGRGFVDLGQLPHSGEDWAPVGTATEFEVVQVRFSVRPGSPDLEIRLRPTAGPPPGGPWPRRGPR
ncbi:hypothetical protein [Streptomyces pactum]|uniref:S1 motif domain-containing protein n=1 Tax=Streptomyces pactum TaxID=68249 RepID=A0A1S6J4J2_9ACTN|nr:hypothetical protein [Streptomyces pactum]AQS66689.1 hypothetical protein B1H29_06880 [Streptomyces pactum]